MQKIAFYLMNSKGFFVFKNFIEKFGPGSVAYVVSEQDLSVKYDGFYDLKALSEINKVPFYQRSHFDAGLEADFSGFKFAIGWRWLIKNDENLIVFHDSLLPKYRGFAPLVNSLINKELSGGVTAFFSDRKYDRGDIISQKSIDFCYPLKIQDAIRRIEPLYFQLVDEIYSRVLTGDRLTGLKQDENQATYSLWLDREDYFIDWVWSAEKIKRFVDAVGFPFDGAKSKLNNEVIVFREVDVHDDVIVEHRERHIGKVIFFEHCAPVIVCSQGLLILKEFTDTNGNVVNLNFRSRFK